jgi:DNA-binding NarL/FixJ family response regulator
VEGLISASAVASEMARTQAVVMTFCAQHGLSPRESAVVALLSRGFNPKAIACELNCSPSTTTTYFRRLLRKLSCCCTDRQEVAPTLLYLALTSPPRTCRHQEEPLASTATFLRGGSQR